VAFRDGPGEATWGAFIYLLTFLVTERGVRPILRDIDPWPSRTEGEIDLVDRFWSSGHWDD
jgi:hypothetical protein